MRYNEFLSEDELFEINMSPSNLTKLVKDIPGAMVGLEFEMIVPDAKVTDDDNSGENDYDQDERCDDIDDIVDFFQRGNGGDYNNAERLRDRLREAYWDWMNERIDDSWGHSSNSEVRNWIENNTSIKEDAMEEYREENPDADEDEVDAVGETAFEAAVDEAMDGQWDNEYYQNAYDEYREDQESDMSERDWLRDQGYRYMSDIENNFDETYWPYQHSAESETNIEAIGEEFSDAVGREVKASAGYHNINRGNQAEEGFYILETDGSLRPDDEDDEAGLEFVSPPLPIGEMMEEIKKVAAWAKQRGAYTGKHNKTGLHMNVSVPNYGKDKLDFVKLALLLGDNHILKEFDRYVVQGTNYAQSSFDLLAKSLKNNPDKAKKMMDAMKGHFDLAASKAIHSGSTDKYTSINVKENRVEFRGPGNDYLGLFASNPNKLLAPMMRMAVALEAACDPEKYRNEYQKKLYKLLSSSVKSKDLLELFTDYAAGKGFPQSAYKSFLKQRKTERELSKGVSPGDNTVGGRKSNPDGNWILFRQHRTGDNVVPYDVEVLYRFNAADQNDATVVMDQYVRQYKPDFQVKVGSDPSKKWGQPKSAGSNWGIYRKSDSTTRMKYRGEYIRFDNMSKEAAEKEMRDLFSTAHTVTALDDFELRPLSKYEIYSKSDGRVVNGTDGKPLQFDAGSEAEANFRYPSILSDFNISAAPGEYDIRSVLTPPAHTTTTSSTRTEQQAWQIINQRTNLVAEEFLARDRAHAVQKFQDFLLRAQQVGRNPNDYTLQLKGSDDGETPAQTAPTATGAPQATASNGVPMWVIYRISDGEVVHRFADHVSSHSRTALSWLRDQNYENPAMTFRVRAMTQDEQEQQAAPGSTVDLQRQRAHSTQTPNWEITRDGTNVVVYSFHAANQDDAIAKANDYIRSVGGNIDDYTVQSIEPPATQAQGGFTGYWKIIDSDTGEELYRFSGVGNVQADANRVASQWLQQHGPEDADMTEISVLPVMGNQ